jgi:histidyl-tRNA synthetase
MAISLAAFSPMDVPMVKPRTMPGVLELLPSEQVTFQGMLDTIRNVYERFGFLPIETPAIEIADVLLTKTGGETERQVYFVQSTGALEKEGSPEHALRFDLTVPLARYVAEHEHELTFPFRRYQCQRVYRGESPQRGRFREFYQCDIDVIGRDSLSLRHDAEIPAVIEQIFDELAIGPFTIRVNNRRLMRGLLATQGVADEATQVLALREIDRLERRGPEAVDAGLSALGLSPGARAYLTELVAIKTSTHDEAMAVLDRLDGPDEQLASGVQEMRTVLETMRALGVSESNYSLDLSIARGLDYYTGTVYETSLDEHPEIGSICSGGRYDNLAENYTSTHLPGVGISIGLTRLFWQLREANIIPIGGTTVTALVTLMDEDGLAYALMIARRLREAGVNTESAVDAAKLAKQLKYADRNRIRFALIAGSDERERGTVTIKDLTAQDQHEMAVDDAAAFIVSRSK